jgi:hypothetical protein
MSTGLGRVLSSVASFRAAKMLAATSKTRFLQPFTADSSFSTSFHG